MANTKYSQKLQNPKWQRKRLEIMQRDNFCCSKCQNDQDQLEVHHLKYIPGKQPWESPGADLITLCNTCHELEHGIVKIDQNTTLQNYILHLQSFFKTKISWEEEQNILSQIVALYKKRKELVNGTR